MDKIILPNPTINYISDGEDISAAITNRPSTEIEQNLETIKNISEKNLNNYNASVFGDFVNYDKTVVYKKNDIVIDSSTIKYVSLIDNNVGNAVTDTSSWAIWTDLPTEISVYKKSEIDAGTIVLNAIKKVDGAGSGLDADLLDGHDSTYFAPQINTYTKSEIDTISNTIEADAIAFAVAMG